MTGVVCRYNEFCSNEEHNFMINSEQLIGTTIYLKLYKKCYINRLGHNWVRHYLLKVYS